MIPRLTDKNLLRQVLRFSQLSRTAELHYAAGAQPGRNLMPRTPGGPKSPLARYAFEWSDEKPDKTFWAIVALMFLYVVYKFATL